MPVVEVMFLTIWFSRKIIVAGRSHEFAITTNVASLTNNGLKRNHTSGAAQRSRLFSEQLFKADYEQVRALVAGEDTTRCDRMSHCEMSSYRSLWTVTGPLRFEEDVCWTLSEGVVIDLSRGTVTVDQTGSSRSAGTTISDLIERQPNMGW